MNYQRIYNELIINRQNNPLQKGIYTEKHHIIPKSLGGGNNKSNIVALSAREHFIAHWLLAKIYGGKMWSAFFFMCHSNSCSAKGILAKSYIYSNAKTNASVFMAKKSIGSKNSFFGKKHTKESILKIKNNHVPIVGSAHHKFNNIKINFLNIKTQKIEYCTQNKLRKKYNLDHRALSAVANGHRKSYKGWINTEKVTQEQMNKPRNKGVLHYKLNKDIFNFVNSEGHIFTGTKYDLLQFDTSLHGSGIIQLCKKKIKTHKGWKLL